MTKKEAAQHYLDLGFQIIPLKPYSKVPAVDSVQEFRERTPTTEELDDWFMERDCNVAILTGENLVVIDIDDINKIQKYREEYPTTVVSETPQGGQHLLYRRNGRAVPNSVGTLEENVDTRGHGGYIVAAPSIVNYYDPEDGTFSMQGVYSWLLDDFENMPPFPDALITQLARKVDSIEVTPNADDAAKIWANVLQSGFDPGRHNVQTKDVARYLYRMMQTPENQQRFIVQTMLELDQRDRTPQGSKQTIATTMSGLRYERERLSTQSTKGFVLHRHAALMAEYYDYNVDWWLEQWLPRNSLILVSAPPEAYKTWIILDMAVTMAFGSKLLKTPFLGQIEGPADPVPVILVQQEDFVGLLMQRLRTIEAAKIDWSKFIYEPISEGFARLRNPYNAPIYIHTDMELRFEDESSVARLEERVSEVGAGLVILDPLYSASKADDFFAGTARELQMPKRIRNKHRSDLNTSFVMTHHNRKSGGVGREQIYGSTLLNAAIEGAVVLSWQDGELHIDKGGKFYSQRETFSIEFDINTEVGDEAYLVTMQPLVAVSAHQEILDLIESMQPVSGAALARELGVDRSTAGRRLAKLVEGKEVAKNDKGWYYILGLDNAF